MAQCGQYRERCKCQRRQKEYEHRKPVQHGLNDTKKRVQLVKHDLPPRKT